MIRISEDEWNMFVYENNLEDEICYRTNVYDNYIYRWETIQRSMVIGIVLLALLLLINAIVVKSILQYEYNINAKELALKKY